MKREHDLILAEVRERFSTRERRVGRTYRAELRNLVLRALHAGCPVGSVATAAGVSRQSVLSWRKCLAGRADPVELQIIAEPAPTLNENTAARVLLRSGAVLEIPFSRLDGKLFALLNGGAS